MTCFGKLTHNALRSRHFQACTGDNKQIGRQGLESAWAARLLDNGRVCRLFIKSTGQSILSFYLAGQDTQAEPRIRWICTFSGLTFTALTGACFGSCFRHVWLTRIAQAKQVTFHTRPYVFGCLVFSIVQDHVDLHSSNPTRSQASFGA